MQNVEHQVSLMPYPQFVYHAHYIYRDFLNFMLLQVLQIYYFAINI